MTPHQDDRKECFMPGCARDRLRSGNYCLPCWKAASLWLREQRKLDWEEEVRRRRALDTRTVADNFKGWDDPEKLGLPWDELEVAEPELP